MRIRLLVCFACVLASWLAGCAAEDGRLYKTPSPLVGTWTTADYQPAADRVSPKKGSVIYIDGHGHGILSFRRDLGCDLEVSSCRRSTGIVTFLNYPRERLTAPGYLESCVSFVFVYDPKTPALKFLKLTGKGITPNVQPQPGQIYRKSQSKLPADWHKLPHYFSIVI